MNFYLLFSGLLVLASCGAICHLFFKAGVAQGRAERADDLARAEWELAAVKRRLAVKPEKHHV